jgi:16S rRNA (cytosine967-C5)-methyltransferase
MLAVRALIDFQKHRDWQRLKLPQLPNSSDQRLFTNLLQGTLRHHRWLQAELNARCDLPWKKLQKNVQCILLVAAYELLFLREEQQRPALHAAVEHVRAFKLDARSGLVNAVLRQLQRDQQAASLDPKKHPLSVSTSHPDWMVARWKQQFGAQPTAQICEANNAFAGITLVPTQLEAVPHLQQLCRELELEPTPHPHFPELICVARTAGLWESAAYRDGKFYVQDASSYAFTQSLRPLLQGTVLDVCAAPGGKGLAFADLSNITLLLNDISRSRLRRVQENAHRLQPSSSVALLQSDGAALPFRSASLDVVLLDVPCSSTGTIRKSPDLKWVQDESELLRQLPLQRRLLQEAARVLRSGGLLIHSTCSLEHEETQLPLQMQEELALVPEAWAPLPPTAHEATTGHWQLLPSEEWMGFSATRMRKR